LLILNYGKKTSKMRSSESPAKTNLPSLNMFRLSKQDNDSSLSPFSFQEITIIRKPNCDLADYNDIHHSNWSSQALLSAESQKLTLVSWQASKGLKDAYFRNTD